MRIGAVDGFPLAVDLDMGRFGAFRLEQIEPRGIQVNECDPTDPELVELGSEAMIHDVCFDVTKRSEDLLGVGCGLNWSTRMTSSLLGYSWQQS